MADTTRRAALGAIIAAPAVVALGASAAMAIPVNSREWDIMLARFRKVEAHHDRLGDAWEEAFESEPRAQNEKELWAALQEHIPSYRAARNELMAVPAPTFAALLVKMELAANSKDDGHADATLADARRLLSGEAEQ